MRKTLQTILVTAFILASNTGNGQTLSTATTPPTREYQIENQNLIQYWESQVKNNNPLIRKSALRNLSSLKATGSLSVIVEASRDTVAEVRSAAARALGLLGDDRVIPILKEQVNRDHDAQVRRQAGRAIDQIKERLAMKESQLQKPLKK